MISHILSASVENLYKAFSRYSRPTRADVSPYAGIRDEDIQRLTSRPLRQLEPNDVRAYTWHALTTWGDDREFRHYLPRLFELLTVASHWTDAALLVGKLHGEWERWPDEERSAVLHFLDALWDWALENSADTISAGDVLQGLGLADLDLDPFLERWHRAPSHASAAQLAYLVCLERSELLASGSVSSYWHPKDRVQMSRFLLAPETRTKLEAAYLAEPNDESARDLADVVAALEIVAASHSTE